jgi:hypothetical protein
MNNRLYVGADVSMNGNVQIRGNIISDVSMSNRLYVGADVSMNGNVQIRGNIIGDVSMNNRLYVGADTMVSNQLNIGGNLRAMNNLYTVGDASLNSRLFVGTDTTMNGNLIVKGYVSGAPSSTPTVFSLNTDPSLNNYYTFDVSYQSGNFIANTSTGSPVYDASLVNGATISSAAGTYIVGNGAVYLNKTLSQHVSLPTITLGPNGFTLATWFKSNASGQWCRIVVLSSGPGINETYLAIDTSGNLAYSSQNGAVVIYTLLYVNDNNWRHVAVSVTSSGVASIYINGIVYNSPYVGAGYPPNIATARTMNYVGKSPYAPPAGIDGYYNGYVDDVRIYNRPLSGSEINQIYNYTGISSNSLVVASDVFLNSRLYVGADVSMNGNLQIRGNIISDVSMNNRLVVVSDVSFNRRLQVAGDVSMNGNVQIGGNLIIGASTIPQSAIIGGVGSSNFTTDVSMTNRLFVGSDVSMNKRLQVAGDVSMNGNVQIRGNIIGDVSMNNRLYIGGGSTLSALSASGTPLVVQSLGATVANFIGGTGYDYQLYYYNNGSTYFGTDGGSFAGQYRYFQNNTQDKMRFYQGTAGALSLQPVAGNVGIGQTAPAYNLDVSGTGRFTGDLSLNQRLYVKNDVSMNGNVQIGGSLIIGASTIPASAIIGGGGGGSNFTTDISGQARLYIASDTSLNGNLQMGKNVAIGTTISTYALDVSGPVRSNNQFTGTAFSATSDYRIKASPISLLDPSINKLFTVNDLNPVYYYNTIAKKPDVGFIAHEMQEYLPLLVNGVKDGDEYQSVNYLGLTTILVKEIQELKKRVAELESQIGNRNM